MRNLATLAEDCAPLEYVVGEALAVPELEAALCLNMAVGGHNAAACLERAAYRLPKETQSVCYGDRT